MTYRFLFAVLLSLRTLVAAPGDYIILRENTSGPSSQVRITPRADDLLTFTNGVMGTVPRSTVLSAVSLDWISITGKPSTFPPTLHAHAISEVTGLQNALDAYLTSATAASTYQPLDSDLTSIAGLSTTTFGRSILTLNNAAALRTAAELGTLATQSANIADYLTSAAASAAYQPVDADLTAIAALATTIFGRSILTQADGPALRQASGVEDVVSGVSEVTTCEIVIGQLPNINNCRIDFPIPSLDNSKLRVWFNYTGMGTNPGAPSGLFSSIVEIQVNDIVTEADVASLLRSAVNGQFGMTAEVQDNVVTVTAQAGDIADVDGSAAVGAIVVSTITQGVDGYRKLTASRMDQLLLDTTATGALPVFDGSKITGLKYDSPGWALLRHTQNTVPEFFVPENPQVARLSGDVTSTSTAMSSVTELNVTLKASRKYLVILLASHASGTTTAEGSLFSLYSSATPTNLLMAGWSMPSAISVNSAFLSAAWDGSAAGVALTGPGPSPPGLVRPYIIIAYINNGATDATVYARVRTETGGSNYTTVKAGSILMAVPLSSLTQ